MNPGDTISHYRILEKLGEGGMGVVYKAEDTNLRRTVAIKFIHPKAATQQEFRERFRREAHAAAVIDHPNVCHVHEFQESGDDCFIVMSFIDGCNLRDCMEATKLSPSNAVDIAMQVAQGLKAAHHKGIIHRDLKPGNIMVNTDGQVKITDFGLAFLADRSRLTAPGTIMGTFSYMSPEQAQAKTIDRRSDLWAVGCLIYELIRGVPPFVDSSGRADLRGVVQNQPDLKPLAKISPELHRITAKLLQKDPGMRYQHADDVVVDLKMLLKQMPEPLPLRIGKTHGIEQDVAQDATTVVNRPTVPAAPVPPTTQSSRTGLWIALILLVVVLLIAALFLATR